MAERMMFPPALAAWGPELAVLEVDIAIALGPLVRQIDQVMAHREMDVGRVGEPDGFNAIAHRGNLAHVLASEWALADELPLEFLRRATSAELLYLAPAFLEPRSPGKVTVLVDTGPDQVGAGRLVQLAALIALHRRCRSQGYALGVGVLGDEPGSWLTGDFDAQLRTWLTARRDSDPTPTDVHSWLASTESEDDTWLLVGQRLATEYRGRRRLLTSRVCAWSGAGGTAVEVLVEGRRVELALPAGPTAVRTLRGAGFRSRGPALGGTDDQFGTLRYPTFPSQQPRLLARGVGDNELMAVTVRENEQSTRVRRHSFGGRVIAATFVGQRTVAVIELGSELRVEVIGKPLGHLDRISISRGDVPISAAEVDEACAALHPAYFVAGDLVFSLGERWIWLTAEGGAHIPTFAAIAAGRAGDQPRIAYQSPWAVVVNGMRLDPETQVVFGHGDLTASRAGGSDWVIRPGETEVRVDRDLKVLGLLDFKGEPALLTISPAGLILRMHTLSGTRTLTKWSGAVAAPALHPTKPWLAVQRDGGSIEIADLTSDTVLTRIRGTL